MELDASKLYNVALEQCMMLQQQVIELKALYIIVNAGFASQIVDIARENGSTGATIFNARGSVANPKTIFGIT